MDKELLHRLWPVIIIGGGPGAALQLCRMPVSPEQVLVISPSLGGWMEIMGLQRLQSYVEELELGSQTLSLRESVELLKTSPTGKEYANYVRSVIKQSRASIMTAQVEDVWREGDKLQVGIVALDGKTRFTATARSVVLATGTRPKQPNLEWQAVGAISFAKVYSDLADGRYNLYRNKSVYFVGCGNSAMQLAALLAPVAANVTVLASRYIGMYPFETIDRFAWRGRSQLACELVAKSPAYCDGTGCNYPCVRYIVYDELNVEGRQKVVLTYRSERNMTLLGQRSLPPLHHHQNVAPLLSKSGEWVETINPERSVLVWSTGVEPVYPTGYSLSQLPRDAHNFLRHDSLGQTDIPGLFVAGACAGNRAVNEMLEANLKLSHVPYIVA